MFAFLALSVLATLSYGLPITPTATTGSVSGTMSSAPSQATASSSALGRGSNGTVAAAWFEGWSSTFNASSIPWDKYTHVTYSFAVTVQDGSLDLSGSGDVEGLATFVKTAHANNVKALASIGGWSGSHYFSTNLATVESRQQFVKTVTEFAVNFELDGIDLDWEFPVAGGQACNNYSLSDTSNYLAFVTALRAANPNLLLTAAASIKPWKDALGNPRTDVSAFAAAFDWVAIMNYDEFGQWSATAGPNAALDDSCAPVAAQQGSAVSAVAAWTAAGVPANQLVLGVASYGHAFNVTNTAALSNGSSTDTGSSQLALFPAFSPWTVQPGELALTECGAPVAKDVQYTFAGLIQAGFLTANGTAAAGIASTCDNCSQTPFVYDAANGTYVSFDDATSFAAKGKFIQSMGLRGFAMWEASGDYQNILLDSIRGSVGL